MKRQIYVNLPVKDLAASMQFFRALGFEFNAQFTGPAGGCMIVSDEIYVMLLTEEFFRTFTPKSICDATKQTEAINCLSCSSRAEVDELVRKAVAAGGKTFREPQVHGEMMYGHSFTDLDGHIWELMYMAPPKA
jgi:predicted lactoylglutathione lyase